MTDQAAIRALLENIFQRLALFILAEFTLGVVVIVVQVLLVIERYWKRGLRSRFLRRPGRVEFSIDNHPVEPERGQFRTYAFRFLHLIVTADTIGREGLGRLIYLFFIEVTDEAFLVAGRALFDS